MSSLSSANVEKETCRLCGFETFKKRNLKLHEQVVHKEKTFKCPLCEHQATQKGDLIRHQQQFQI